METIKTSQKSYQASAYLGGSICHANDMEAKRKALYKEAQDYSTEVYGWYDDIEEFASIFDTSAEVVKYYQDECAVFEGEDPEELGTHLEWRGDIIKIGDKWFGNI